MTFILGTSRLQSSNLRDSLANITIACVICVASGVVDETKF